MYLQKQLTKTHQSWITAHMTPQWITSYSPWDTRIGSHQHDMPLDHKLLPMRHQSWTTAHMTPHWITSHSITVKVHAGNSPWDIRVGSQPTWLPTGKTWISTHVPTVSFNTSCTLLLSNQRQTLIKTQPTNVRTKRHKREMQWPNKQQWKQEKAD